MTRSHVLVVLLAAGFALLTALSTITPTQAAIPASSCMVSGACDSLGANVVIGANSCNGTDACDNLGDNVVIGENSCNGPNACDHLGAGTTVGNNSCSGPTACNYLSGTGATSGVVGSGSCNGQDACDQAGDNGGNASIGDGSCNGDAVCKDAGEGQGFFQVGDGSCNDGESSCLWAGKTGGLSIIGNQSCLNGDYACDSVGDGGESHIGDNACSGEQACAGASYLGGTSTIGNGSCNGALVCQTKYDSSSFSVGQFSCNNGDQSPPCRYNASDIGDCVYNDVTPAPCMVDFSIEKTVSEAWLPVGGGNVTFQIRIQNMGSSDITVTSLHDNVFGNLDGKGSCHTPAAITAGASYVCSFTETIEADHVDTVTAAGMNEYGVKAQESDSASVRVEEPTASVTPSPSPESRPGSPRGNRAAVFLGAILSQTTATPTLSPQAPLAAGTGSIRPPNTGDGGLVAGR